MSDGRDMSYRGAMESVETRDDLTRPANRTTRYSPWSEYS